jgi:DNA invertase Pin-like site-specific DNA recombinase
MPTFGIYGHVERDLRTRTAEGRSRAKAQGKHMGRPPFPAPAQQKRPSAGAQRATLQELAHSYNVSRATISRLPRVYR